MKSIFVAVCLSSPVFAATQDERTAAKAYRDYYQAIRAKKGITAAEIQKLQKEKLQPALVELNRKALEKQRQHFKRKGFRNAKGAPAGGKETDSTKGGRKIEASRKAGPRARDQVVDLDPSQIPKELEFSGKKEKKK